MRIESINGNQSKNGQGMKNTNRDGTEIKMKVGTMTLLLKKIN